MLINSEDPSEIKSFKETTRRLKKLLETDNDDYVDALEKFISKYSCPEYKSFLKDNQIIIKDNRLLELVLETVLPATFANIFLNTLWLFSVVGKYLLDYFLTPFPYFFR